MLPNKQLVVTTTSSIYLSRPSLLWSTTAVSICLAITSIVAIVPKVSTSNRWPSPSQETYIWYSDGVLYAPQSGYSFFESGERLLFASAAVCIASSLVAVVTVYHSVKKGPWSVSATT